MIRSFLQSIANRLFFEDLVKRTNNFSSVRWMGVPVWQNILDLWVIQETIVDIRPELVIETGTHRGGSALFYASILDGLEDGRVISVDVESDASVSHPRVEFLRGDSVDPEIVDRVARIASGVERVMVILDSDHSASHVRCELEAYGTMVNVGGFLLVQDTIVDRSRMFRDGRPGPSVALDEFILDHPEFERDPERSRRFLVSHHPGGWIKRIRR